LLREKWPAAAQLHLSWAAVNLAAASSDDPVAIAQSAYIWGFPIVLTSRYRALAADYPLNQFTLSTRLSSPDDKVAGPDVDTLYGFGFLDVSQEPLILHIPDSSALLHCI
jgi:hypothetical protein